MDEINKIEVVAPIRVKDIVLENILDLGVDIVSTRNVIYKA